MLQLLSEMIEKQAQVLEDLKKRLAGVQVTLSQAQQEQQRLIADILHADGVLEGLKSAMILIGETKGDDDATGIKRV